MNWNKSALGLMALVWLSSASYAQSIRPFTSDGCSLFPDAQLFGDIDWLPCCVAHDYAYWQGGSAAQRKEADIMLKECVAKLGAKKTGRLMLWGVRLGGSPYWPTPFRWGYGWPYLRGYQPLSAAEQDDVKQQTSQYFQDYMQDN